MAAAEDEEEVDIEGLEEGNHSTDYREVLENTESNNYVRKGNIQSPSSSFFSEYCDSNSWILDSTSVWSLDHCEDEKSRATIEKMIMEEELYSHGYGRMLEVPTTPANAPGKAKNSVPQNSKKQFSKPKKPTPVESLSSTHRKPWSREEQELFEQGLRLYGRSWTHIASLIDGRTVLQVKNYANQYFRNKNKLTTLAKGKLGQQDEPQITNSIKIPEKLQSPTSDIKTTARLEHCQVHVPGRGEESKINAGSYVFIENTSDDEEIEIDIDGDSDPPSDDTVTREDVYQALLRSAPEIDREDRSSDTEVPEGMCSPSEKDESSAGGRGDPLAGNTLKSSISHSVLPEDKVGSHQEDQCIRDPNLEREVTGHDLQEFGNESQEFDFKGDNCSAKEVNSYNNMGFNTELEDSKISNKNNKDFESDEIISGNSLPNIKRDKYMLNGSELLSCVSNCDLRNENSKGLEVEVKPESLNPFTEDDHTMKQECPCVSSTGEVTSNFSTESRPREPAIADDQQKSKLNINLNIKRDIILEEEKKWNQEFFMGRSLKTPTRYMKIRNYILDMWDKYQPNYLFKTSVRSGLRSCGDVNSIGRVHAFLEDIGAINIGCPERPKPRVRHTSESGPDKIEEPPMESWVNFLRPRKRRLKDDVGDWVDETEAEGLTITHLTSEGEDEQKQTQEKTALRRPKVPRTKLSYDPFQLVPCRKFPSSSAMPFKVLVQSDALVVMDAHAHFSTTEVIGLLGGTYSTSEQILQILRATPCESLSTGMQCEMDPVSQTQASEDLASKGLAVVGWYHSHPTFAPSPSIRDIETQAKFQEWFAKGGAPFIGVIVSPYNYANTSNQSQITCLTVSDEWAAAGQYRLPYQFDYQIDEKATDSVEVVADINELEAQYRNYPFRMAMTRRHSSSMFTALDKLMESMRARFRGSDEEKQDFLNEVKALFTNDLETWSNERRQNEIKSTGDPPSGAISQDSEDYLSTVMDACLPAEKSATNSTTENSTKSTSLAATSGSNHCTETLVLASVDSEAHSAEESASRKTEMNAEKSQWILF